MPDLTGHAYDLIKSCLELCPEERPDATQLLNHPYFDEFREEYEREIPLLVEKDLEDVLEIQSDGEKFTALQSLNDSESSYIREEEDDEDEEFSYANDEEGSEIDAEKYRLNAEGYNGEND